MDMDLIVLCRGPRTVQMEEANINVATLAMVFRLAPSTIHLMNEDGVVILANAQGNLPNLAGARFEVCGEEAGGAPQPPNGARNGARGFQFQARDRPQAVRPRPPPQARTYTRRISVGRVEAGALLVDGPTIYVPYTAEEANVGTMVRKVREDLRSEETYVLTDTTGNQILPSSGTSGLDFWRQNARRIIALTQQSYEELRRRRSANGSRRRSRLVEAAVLDAAGREMGAINQALQELGQLAREHAMHRLTVEQVRGLRAHFRCQICRAVMVNPMVAPCCATLIGCETCVGQWAADSTTCPNDECQFVGFGNRVFRLTGVDVLMAILARE